MSTPMLDIREAFQKPATVNVSDWITTRYLSTSQFYGLFKFALLHFLFSNYNEKVKTDTRAIWAVFSLKYFSRVNDSHIITSRLFYIIAISISLQNMSPELTNSPGIMEPEGSLSPGYRYTMSSYPGQVRDHVSHPTTSRIGRR